MVHIFISYSKFDRLLAGELKIAFEELEGFTCFVAHDDIIPGSEWEKEILDNLDKANFFMPLQTEHLIKSHWCQQEAGISLNKGIEIVPLIPDSAGVDPIGFYAKYQGCKIKREAVKDSVEKLAKTYLLLNKEKALKKMKVRNAQHELDKQEALAHNSRKFDEFKNELNSKKVFLLSATPIPLVDDIIDVDRDGIQQIMCNPKSYSRPNGWHMGFESENNSLTPFLEGIEKKSSHRSLKIFRNGYLEFRSSVDYNFSHAQEDEEYQKLPRFNPYVIIEYPVSFIRLFKELVSELGLPASVVLRMAYLDCGKYELGQYSPEAIGHRPGKTATIDNIVVEKIIDELDEATDIEALMLVQRIYNAFGYTRDKILFFNEKNIFELPKNRKY